MSELSMSKLWYCQINGREYGPFDSAKLQALAIEKKILPEHLIRQSPSDPWVPANRVTGLFPQARSIPTPAERLWRIKTASNQVNGVTDSQLKQLALSGQLKPDSEMCIEGKEPWFKAATFKGLLPRTTKPRPLSPVITAEIVASKGKHEEPVVVQEPEATKATDERITSASVRKYISSQLPNADNSKVLDYRPPNNSIQFYGPGTIVDIGYGPCANLLVYATSGRLDHTNHPSLIELGLPIGKNGDTPKKLAYFPSYRECCPKQRAAYLKWICDGRTNKDADLGFVFLFYYGLVRRIVVDCQDHQCVVKELIRLISIFGHSKSFFGYATRFLWLAVYLSTNRGGIPADLLVDAVRITKRWRDGSLELYLAYLSRTRGRLDSDACFAWAEQDQRAMKSIAGVRNADKFKELFSRKINDAFPEGVPFPPDTHTIEISQHPEIKKFFSGLQQTNSASGLLMPTLEPRVAPCSMLIQIWNDCVEQLKAFDNANSKAKSKTYLEMPIEFRPSDHPEWDHWSRLISRVTDESDWALVSVNELALIKGITERNMLTKTQTLSILSTADNLGFAIEPDCRINGKNFLWNEPIAIFKCEMAKYDDRSIEKFRTAAFLLELGLSIAVSDNEVDERELAAIESHFVAELELTPDLAKRLFALRHLMILKGPKLSNVPRAFLTVLSKNQRKAIGSYLVSLAVADQVVTAKKKNVLRAAFQKLSLPLDILAELLTPYVSAVAEPQPVSVSAVTHSNTEAPVLDFDRIRRIREETRDVQDLLHEVITNSLDDSVDLLEVKNIDATDAPLKEIVSAETFIAKDSPSSMADQCMDSRFAKVPKRYQAFCSELVMRNRWNIQEAKDLARSQGLMFSAALEAINEWSTEEFGDWLIEEADSDLIVHLTLLERR